MDALLDKGEIIAQAKIDVPANITSSQSSFLVGQFAQQGGLAANEHLDFSLFVTLSADFGNCRSYYNWSLPVFFVLLGKRFLSDRYRVFTIPFINITYSKSTSGRNHTIIIEAAMNTYLAIKAFSRFLSHSTYSLPFAPI